MKITINKSFYNKREQLKEFPAERLEAVARNMAVDAPQLSKYFVDTGAFITSWQITDGRRGRPRGRSSRGLPRRKGDQTFAKAMAQESMRQMQSDIAKIDFYNTTRLVLRNGAPHARYVDAKHSKVIDQLRKKYGRYS
jgi:hypothetical protein